MILGLKLKLDSYLLLIILLLFEPSYFITFPILPNSKILEEFTLSTALEEKEAPTTFFGVLADLKYGSGGDLFWFLIFK